MSFSYSGNPSNSPKDEVRFLVGDTNPNSFNLHDAEIKYMITTEGTVLAAAVAGSLAIASRYAKLIDESVGNVSKSYSQRFEHYTLLSGQLRRRNAEKSVLPYASGISEADKETLETDTDNVRSAFTKNLHDSPGVVNPANDDDRLV